MTTKKELQNELKTLENELEDIQDNTEAYDDMLDEYEVKIWNLAYSWSRALRKLDPIAYDCGFSDFIDEAISEKEQEIEEKKEDMENSK